MISLSLYFSSRRLLRFRLITRIIELLSINLILVLGGHLGFVEKVYNRTYRYVYYEGYEEVDGYLRAQIDSSSKTVEFDKGQSYYYDYPLQVQDAYQSYKIMG